MLQYRCSERFVMRCRDRYVLLFELKINKPETAAPGLLFTDINPDPYGIPSQFPAMGISPETPRSKTIWAKPMVLELRSMNVPLR